MNRYIILLISLFLSTGLNAQGTSVGSEAAQIGKEGVKATVSAFPGAAVKGVVKDKMAGAAEQAAPSITGGIGDFFASSAGVAVLAGLSTVYSGVLYNAAAEQEEESKANIVKIDKIMAAFKDSFIFYCPQGRQSLSEPNCYCYNDDGAENSERTKSQICIDLWAKNKYKLSASSGDYSGVSKFVDPAGCLTSSGKFDENCKCKKFVDSKGTNACMKGTNITIPNGSFGSALMSNTGLKEVMKFAAGSANGNPNFNSFNSGQLGLKAIRAQQFRDALISKIQTTSNSKPGFKQVNEGNALQLAKSIIGEKGMAAAMANSRSALDVGSSGHTDPKAAELLKSAATRAGIDLSGGFGLQNKKASPKEAMNFNFAGENANAASQTQNFPETEKNYNYKNSDISKNSGASIFDIISNRYIQSGLKRLFEN
ncbi:MAG: hypothetical protein H7281_18625 [Bacteriovorax sp.]|nr:hypothetical protein [Bacteriovorax sp.]